MARGDINSGRTGASTRGDAISDREIEAIITRVLGSKFGLSERILQRLGELIGENPAPNGERPLSAVRRQDLSVLESMAPIKGQPLGAAPTAADFNALRDEVRKVYDVLAEIAKAIRGG
ncbi:hypothetical protein [Cupriavidus metallidurans]